MELLWKLSAKTGDMVRFISDPALFSAAGPPSRSSTRSSSASTSSLPSSPPSKSSLSSLPPAASSFSPSSVKTRTVSHALSISTPASPLASPSKPHSHSHSLQQQQHHDHKKNDRYSVNRHWHDADPGDGEACFYLVNEVHHVSSIDSALQHTEFHMSKKSITATSFSSSSSSSAAAASSSTISKSTTATTTTSSAMSCSSSSSAGIKMSSASVTVSSSTSTSSIPGPPRVKYAPTGEHPILFLASLFGKVFEDKDGVGTGFSSACGNLIEGVGVMKVVDTLEAFINSTVLTSLGASFSVVQRDMLKNVNNLKAIYLRDFASSKSSPSPAPSTSSATAVAVVPTGTRIITLADLLRADLKNNHFLVYTSASCSLLWLFRTLNCIGVFIQYLLAKYDESAEKSTAEKVKTTAASELSAEERYRCNQRLKRVDLKTCMLQAYNKSLSIHHSWVTKALITTALGYVPTSDSFFMQMGYALDGPSTVSTSSSTTTTTTTTSTTTSTTTTGSTSPQGNAQGGVMTSLVSLQVMDPFVAAEEVRVMYIKLSQVLRHLRAVLDIDPRLDY